MTFSHRAHGAIIGLGVGDAMGAPVELYTRAQILAKYGGELTELTGYTTDDTAQMIALAEAIDPEYSDRRAIENYVDWYITNGHGIGSNSRYVLGAAADGHDSRVAAREFLSFQPGRPPSNGALMRCAPLAVRYANDEKRMVEAARLDATLTHAHPWCPESVVWYLRLLRSYLVGEPLPALFAPDYEADTAAWDAVMEAAGLELEQVEEWAATRRGMTLVPVAMVARALRDELDLETATVWAVNCGGDADTNAALVAAMLGARDGADAIPDRWRASLYDHVDLTRLADQLVALA